MCFQHFFDLFSDPHGRVQRSHRVLEYHGNFRTTNCLHFSLCIFGQVFSVVHNGSFGHFSILRKDSHDSFHSDGFTGTGLSNDCQSFLLVQIKVYVTDRLYDAFVCFDMYCQITDFQYFSHVSTYFLICGSSASLKPSPRILKHTMISTITIAGQISTCG